jgi:glycosyltransferase involved in cell wall biosynthesis
MIKANLENNKKEVYFFLVGKTIGGVETYIKNIIESEGYYEKYLSILFTHSTAIENYWEDQDIYSVPIEFTSKYGLKKILKLIRCKILKAGNIIHSNDMITAFYSFFCWLLLFGRIRIVITIHSILKEHKVFRHGGKNIQFLIAKLFSTVCNILPVKIISVSKTAKEDLISLGIKKSKIEVIYHGIGYNGKSYFPKSINNIGFIGRLSEEKGFSSFLKLGMMIYPQKKIFIYGMPTCIETLIIFKKNYNFTFAGFVNNLDIIYSRVDVVCITSKTESFCFVLLESLFRKKIIYALDIPIINELLNDFLLLKNEIVCFDITTMKNKILNCDLFLWEKLYKYYYNLLIEKFSLKIFINKTLIIYN